MNTAERNLITARLLGKIYGGAYSSIELNRELRGIADERDRGYVSRLFYGVLDKSVQLDYIISKLTKKRPKPIVSVVLRMGIYMLRYMDEPSYAVVNTHTELIKTLGKRLYTTHIHDNTQNDDSHLPPYDGTTDWETDMNALRSIGYAGPLTMEVVYPTNEGAVEFMKKCYDRCDRLRKILHGEKQ